MNRIIDYTRATRHRRDLRLRSGENRTMLDLCEVLGFENIEAWMIQARCA